MGEEEKPVGEVFNYFSKLGVAGVKLFGSLRTGDRIRVRGSTTDFEQVVESMQVEHSSVSEAGKGDSIGLRVEQRVRPHDKVYRLQ